MQNFLLTTDTSCDISRKELNEKNIPWTPLTFVIDGTTFDDNFSSDSEYKTFYHKIRGGAMPTTSQINIFTHEEFFETALKNGATQILHLSLSSGLSNTYNSATIAAQNIMHKHSNISIKIVDTLSATQGHHFVLDKAWEMQQDGLTLDEAFNQITEFCSRVHHLIIVDDLMHLKRGGRVSGAAAYIGSVLKVKPILIINNLGKLAVYKKVVGFNKALNETIAIARDNIISTKNAHFYIAHADCEDNALILKELLVESFKDCTVKIGYIGPVVGSHTGAGTLGVVFEGNARLTNQ